MGERTLKDTYYDTDDLSLGHSNRWLRSRNGRFELKVPLAAEISELFNEYRELETEEEIRSALAFGWIKFLPRINAFDFGYQIVEIELLVATEAEVTAARSRIEVFARQHGLSIAPVRGKLFEYWRRFKPELYQKLGDAIKQFEAS